MATATVVNETDRVDIPAWVVDLPSFLRWVRSDEAPDWGRIDYIKGRVWIDMSREQVFSHNQVKTEITIVLGGLIKREKLGLYCSDGVRFNNKEIDISTNPDGMFVSTNSFRTRRVRLVEGRRGGFTAVVGVPDLVMEVVSSSSEDKDTELLMKNYWEAGIPEYWLIDARYEPLQFDIYRRTSKGYAPGRKQGGWIKSPTFGLSFQLTPGVNALDQPDYTLSVR